MSIYEKKTMGELVGHNSYVGRGVVIGLTPDGKKAAIAYFIMGRSDNSRNRIFAKEGEAVTIYPFDSSKVEDPSLIIYSPIRKYENSLIVTNGDQTDTIYDALSEGGSFEEALMTRAFEPDAPNLTPRISGIAYLEEENFRYDMSILKSMDEIGSSCGRYFYRYEAIPGLGHFIHTYEGDGNPLPTFQGAPKRVDIPESLEAFAQNIWENLDGNNKISLYACHIDLKTGKREDVLYNLNKN